MEYQRVWAEIDLDCIAHNIGEVRRSIAPGVNIMAAVKADAYGHGAVEAAKVLLYNGANMLGVAICDEGISLRENNIGVPILILGYSPNTKLSDVVKYNLIQTIFCYDMARELSAAAKKLGRVAQAHIKIDTGMSRLGFMPDLNAVGEIMKIAELPNLNITGIYTHFATSDSSDKGFTYEQNERYSRFLRLLGERAGALSGFMRHASNSAAIMSCPDLNYDCVRPGIMLYGLDPSGGSGETGEGFCLKPAMSFKTRISYIKTLKAGVSVGYGRRYFTERESVVATVPVGYGDGYLRSMANGGRVLVGGEYAPIIGNLCMDQFMVDITDIAARKTVKPEDEIVLIGTQGKNTITAAELAAIQGTISYEIVCNIGKRVPRVYIKDNVTLKTINFLR